MNGKTEKEKENVGEKRNDGVQKKIKRKLLLIGDCPYYFSTFLI